MKRFQIQNYRQRLHANYFESTGEPHDDELMKQLPIFRNWSNVRQIVREHGLADLLDVQFRKLRNRHVGRSLEHLKADYGLEAPEVTVGEDEILLDLSMCLGSDFSFRSR